MNNDIPEKSRPDSSALPPTLPPPSQDLPTLHESVPPAQAMMAFKQFAARDPEANLSLLVGVPLNHVLFEHIQACYQQEGFATIPGYNTQSPAQRALIWYLAGAWRLSARRLCCGIKNLNLENVGDHMGSFSNPARTVEDPRYEPCLSGLRRLLAELNPKNTLHYACLPPLEISLLTDSPEAEIGLTEDASAKAGKPFSLEKEIDAAWIGARSRDPSYATWVGKHWPQGVPARKLLDATYYADWMIACLGATLFPPYTMKGKRMLVRFAHLAAVRAARWSPSEKHGKLIRLTEQWIREPSEANRMKLREALQAKTENVAQQTEAEQGFGYINQAASEAIVSSARSAGSNDARVIAEAVGRAAMGSVMTATFASQAPAENTWLEMVSSHAVPDELAEHCGLCVVMRGMALNPQNAFEDLQDTRDLK